MDRHKEDREEQAGRCHRTTQKTQDTHVNVDANSPQLTMDMKYHLILVSIVLSFAYGWMPQHATPRTFVHLDIGKDGPGDTMSSTEMTNPCWQDFYDEDCETNFAAASFVAAKWIEKMPCGAGIQVGVASDPSIDRPMHRYHHLLFLCVSSCHFASLLSLGL